MPDEINDNRLGVFTLDILRSDQLKENTVRYLANAYANNRLLKRPMFTIKPANDEEEFYEATAPYREAETKYWRNIDELLAWYKGELNPRHQQEQERLRAEAEAFARRFLEDEEERGHADPLV